MVVYRGREAFHVDGAGCVGGCMCWVAVKDEVYNVKVNKYIQIQLSMEPNFLQATLEYSRRPTHRAVMIKDTKACDPQTDVFGNN